jgi:hypothetical protein
MRMLVALLLVGLLAALAAKLAPMEFVAHKSKPTVTTGAEFHRALDVDLNAASSASSAPNSLQNNAPVELRQHSTRPPTMRKGWPQ